MNNLLETEVRTVGKLNIHNLAAPKKSFIFVF